MMASHYQQHHHGFSHAQGGSSSSTSSPRPPINPRRQHSSSEQYFTPEMRDLQARGRDPYTGESNSHAGDWPGHHRYHHGARETIPHTVMERSRMARDILDQPELLMMVAQKEDDSIPATRLRYMRIMCCLPDKPVSSLDSQVRSTGSDGGSNNGGSNRRQQQQQQQQQQQSRQTR
ncbi:uncharacterized protein B0I36DRAFT_310037 [Microdochium trichocladiopsis]|uniref:Uncharacterized protein n=1 Tax=Microdochium trichocladiopsis TaxID=1682393 RepID=A0A9P8YHL0_9PEZI|nr:uncharacterized protein B0I36DRAFT_310037 [Microdochium trichocladiopsis]KAH7040147.1 hypothetical protein B0I36DRAFT_310037 [Microdochium trichocladiopsis]